MNTIRKTPARVLAHKLAKPEMKPLSDQEINSVSGAGTVIYCGGNGGYERTRDTVD